MSDKLTGYAHADAPLPQQNKLWPLYGAGFENLGRDGKLIETDFPTYGSDELLVRHDAIGICFSDIKVIRAGENHPRIYRNMAEDPVVLGHEVSLTIVGVGEDLQDDYAVGDRFIVQADIYLDGVSYAYGYEIQGGFSQYNVVDQRVLDGDHGNYLIRVKPTTGYAEAALNEPWACVEASYTVVYRTTWQEGGTLWLVGDGAGLELGTAAQWRPGQIVLDVADSAFAAQVRDWAQSAGVNVVDDDGEMRFDDIVILGNDPELIERAFPRLANDGSFNVVSREPVARRVQLDVGRLHYDNLLLVGTSDPDISTAYGPVRTQLKPGGALWVLGAAGPMGHMHLQRALEIGEGPATVVATNLKPAKMESTERKFAGSAGEHQVNLVCLSRGSFASDDEMDAELRSVAGGRGYDDIAVMAPSTSAIESVMDHLADNGVLNVFAGLPRGTQASFDLNPVVRRGVRITGTSGSSIDDLRHMLELTESNTLSTNGAVAAIAGLEGVDEGLQAVANGRFPGKVVIYPHIRSLPLITLAELEEKFPSVFARLKDGQIWTTEAEQELLELMLP